jgi:hypothetical protein
MRPPVNVVMPFRPWPEALTDTRMSPPRGSDRPMDSRPNIHGPTHDLGLPHLTLVCESNHDCAEAFSGGGSERQWQEPAGNFE